MMADTKKPALYGSAADEKWGYEFGVDGLMDAKAARTHLSRSDRQLDRFAEDGLIRKGRFPGSNVRAFCKRSVVNFAKSLEE